MFLLEIWDIIIENAQKHDEIFALSSHIPHLVSFCAAKSISQISNKNINIIDQENKGFACFIRLAYSNPKMWTDIFISNKQAILSIIDKYYLGKFDLSDKKSLDLLDQNLQKIIALRTQIFRTAIFRTEITPPPLQVQSIIHPLEERLIINILPLLISAKIVEPIIDIFDNKMVGAGFLGMTRNLVNINFSLHDLNSHQLDIINLGYKKFITEIKIIYNAVKLSDPKKIFGYLDNL